MLKNCTLMDLGKNHVFLFVFFKTMVTKELIAVDRDYVFPFLHFY